MVAEVALVIFFLGCLTFFMLKFYLQDIRGEWNWNCQACFSIFHRESFLIKYFKKYFKQECIPVGMRTGRALTVSGGGGVAASQKNFLGGKIGKEKEKKIGAPPQKIRDPPKKIGDPPLWTRPPLWTDRRL